MKLLNHLKITTYDQITQISENFLKDELRIRKESETISL